MRGRRNTDADAEIVGSMTNAAARDQISEAVGTDNDGAMFDETIVAYKKVREDAERLMIGAIRSQFPHVMRPYTQRPSWTTVDTDPDSCESCRFAPLLRTS